MGRGRARQGMAWQARQGGHTMHVIQEYDLKITALEQERDRLVAYLRDIRSCLGTGNLDITDMQKSIGAAVSIANLALKGEE